MSVQWTKERRISVPAGPSITFSETFSLEGCANYSLQRKTELLPPSAPLWDALTTYNPGDLVTYNAVEYIALTVSTGLDPDVNPSDWAVYTLEILITLQGTSTDSNVVGVPDPSSWTTITSVPASASGWATIQGSNVFAFKYGRLQFVTGIPPASDAPGFVYTTLTLQQSA